MKNITLANKQQGVVLIVALIMVVAVTGVAVSLMNSSSIDIKITNSAQERETVENELVGIVYHIIAKETAKNSDSAFFKRKVQIPKNGLILEQIENEISTMKNLNNGPSDIKCPRRFDFSIGVACNLVQIETSVSYGIKSTHTLTIITGIAQQKVSSNSGV